MLWRLAAGTEDKSYVSVAGTPAERQPLRYSPLLAARALPLEAKAGTPREISFMRLEFGSNVSESAVALTVRLMGSETPAAADGALASTAVRVRGHTKIRPNVLVRNEFIVCYPLKL
jgi:hypothetical protein